MDIHDTLAFVLERSKNVLPYFILQILGFLLICYVALLLGFTLLVVLAVVFMYISTLDVYDSYFTT